MASQVHHVMQLDVLGIPCHIPSVHLHALRAALSHASRTTPYRDFIQYPMVSPLNDSHLPILAGSYNLLLSCYEVEALYFGDFTLLFKKRSHGVVANAHPPSHLSVLCKLFSMVIIKALQCWLIHRGRISRTQLGMQRPTSVSRPSTRCF